MHDLVQVNHIDGRGGYVVSREIAELLVDSGDYYMADMQIPEGRVRMTHSQIQNMREDKLTSSGWTIGYHWSKWN